jgi:hypothetical protein
MRGTAIKTIKITERDYRIPADGVNHMGFQNCVENIIRRSVVY